ncbi:MAG: hypothetical protein H6741_03570 [Alphaproteobacteria bacterium]|nr:hypothetical protein [Alphaproteobacteria bacterium]MCB9791784.1 hypothetical protein [Alphaproteobacteria bacterium]
MRRIFLLTIAVAAGCKGSLDLGGGPDADARLTADVFTWECQDPETGSVYQGAFSFDVSLEYAPDGLQDRVLPGEGGCSAELSMFPFDAGEEGDDIPGINGPPRWSTPEDQGAFERMSPGFYFDEVFSNEHTCADSADILAEGLTLEDAGPLDGVTSPEAGGINWVDVDDANGDGLIDFGEDLDITWDAEGWDEAFVQIRLERDGEAWDTVTCGAGSADGFTVDSDVWDLLNDQLNVEYINLYVGFRNEELVDTQSGLRARTVARAMHVLVVQD